MNESKFWDNDKVIRYYLKELKEYPVISHDKQRELLIKAKDGDMKAREKLINSNLRFVLFVAKDYINAGVDFKDLVSSGNLGLVKAIDKWDVNHKVKFFSYAVWWIRNEIKKFLQDEGWTVRRPCNVWKARNKIEKTRDRLNKELGYAADGDVAEKLGIDEKAVIKTDLFMGRSGTQKQEADEIPVKEDEDRDELQNEIKKVLNKLNSTEREIVELYFGFKDGMPLHFEEIGKIVNMSHETARKIFVGAIEKLKKNPKILGRLREYL